MKHLLKVARDRDPFRGLRKKRRGIRRRHLQKLWNEHACIRAASTEAISEWAAETSAWHVLARGGEIEQAKHADLQFKRQKREGLVGSKDPDASFCLVNSFQ